MFLISLGIIFLFFLLGRELICWYFKINQITSLLTEINESLKKDSSYKK